MWNWLETYLVMNHAQILIYTILSFIAFGRKHNFSSIFTKITFFMKKNFILFFSTIFFMLMIFIIRFFILVKKITHMNKAIWICNWRYPVQSGEVPFTSQAYLRHFTSLTRRTRIWVMIMTWWQHPKKQNISETKIYKSQQYNFVFNEVKYYIG